MLRLAFALTVTVWAAAPLAGQEPPPEPSNKVQQPEPIPNGEARPVISEAERIAALQQLIATDETRLTELREEVGTISRQFESASANFSDYDVQLTAARKRLEEARRANDEPESARLQGNLSTLEQQWEQARQQFNLVIQRRKTIEQQLSILPQKLQLERQALEGLTTGVVASEGSFFEQPEANSLVASEHGRKEPSPPPVVAEQIRPAEETDVSLAYDPRVAEARTGVAESDRELLEMERRLQWINQGLEVFASDLRNTEELLTTAQRRLDVERQTYERARENLTRLRSSAAPRSEIAVANGEADAAQQRLQQAREEVERYAERIKPLRIQLSQLQEAKEQALLALRKAEIGVSEARDRLRFVESPLAPHRILRWFQDEGLKVLMVALFMFFFWAATRLLGSRLVKTLVMRGRQGSQQEREERAETLRRAFQSVMGIIILSLGGLVILEQMGIDVTVLLGGAAVFGMAIAFAAQTLVRDYFNGFMILMESQYQVGNVIRIGAVAGVVEDVSLRVTVLRDLEGVAHFIPHSQIETVSNLTHGWSRVVFDIGVAYKEDVDRVMDVLVTLSLKMRQDPEFAHLIVDDAEMLGVDAFGDSAVVIKFMIKTRPLKQWVVKRELLRRIKNEFDALGIEIPFPHRTVLHRSFSDKLTIDFDDRQVVRPMSSAGKDGGN